jgi:hypothetical protein
MQVSTGSSSYATPDLQRLLASMQGQQTQGAQAPGQEFPGGDDKRVGKGHHGHRPHPGAASAPPSSGASDQFATDTLSSLLDAQQTPPTAADLANKILSSLDTDGDGSLSLEETTKALPGASGQARDVSSPFAKLDSDGNGQLSAQELTTALSAYQSARAARYAQAPTAEAATPSVTA